MADWVREADEPISPDKVTSTIPIPARSRRYWPSRARVLSLGAAVLASLPTAVYFWFYEGHASNEIFVVSVTLAFGPWLVLAIRRVLVATVLVNSLIGIVSTMSWAKQQAMDMALHAYDLVFYLRSWGTIAFLSNGFRIHILALIAGLIASAF